MTGYQPKKYLYLYNIISKYFSLTLAFSLLSFMIYLTDYSSKLFALPHSFSFEVKGSIYRFTLSTDIVKTLRTSCFSILKICNSLVIKIEFFFCPTFIFLLSFIILLLLPSFLTFFLSFCLFSFFHLFIPLVLCFYPFHLSNFWWFFLYIILLSFFLPSFVSIFLSLFILSFIFSFLFVLPPFLCLFLRLYIWVRCL